MPSCSLSFDNFTQRELILNFSTSFIAAIDIWSAGIILLSILTRKFPIFNSNDDTEALMEISAIFGKTKMDKCASIHSEFAFSTSPSPFRRLTP